jgi:GT2 family glycosyltransferase
VHLSVAICTHNPDRAVLRRVLDAIAEQVEAIEDAEAIVVDNNSTPPLDQWERLSTYRFRQVRQPLPGLTAAREAAIAASTGEILIFIDDDNILGDGYLDVVRRLFAQNPHVGVLGGSVVPEYEGQPPRIGEFESSLAVRRYASDTWIETAAPPYSDHFPIGAGIAVRRELAVEYVADCFQTMRIEGHMGDALTSGEDVDLDLFVLSRGLTLVISGELSITHVIGRARTEPAYLERLIVGAIEGGLALEEKWSPRFGQQPLFPMFSLSLPSLLARLVVAAVTRPCSLRYRLRYRVFATLTRIRVARLLAGVGRSRSAARGESLS